MYNCLSETFPTAMGTMFMISTGLFQNKMTGFDRAQGGDRAFLIRQDTGAFGASQLKSCLCLKPWTNM